jgi:type II secretory pathway pseudopilin PulG
MNKLFSLILGVLVLVSLSVFVNAQPALETSSVLVKVSLNQGDIISRSVSVGSDIGGEFIAKLKGLPENVVIENQRFTLIPNEKYNVNVIFNSTDVKEGVYVGYLDVTNSGERSLIPVIFEVESEDVFFDVNLDIPPQYTELKPGDTLVSQLKVFDLISGGTTNGLGTTNVDIEYLLYGFDGSVLSSETESIVVDRQARITKSLSLPGDLKSGEYVFVAAARYKSSVGISSQLFTVSSQGFGEGFGFDLSDSGLVVLMIVGGLLAFLIIVILLFVFIIRDRDKMLLELRRYNSSELRQQRKFLTDQGRVAVKKGRSKREVKKEIKNKVETLRKRQKKREKVLKNVIKKGGSTKGIKSKLNAWKNKGYNTTALEYKLSGLSTKEMKEIMKKYKR